MEHLTAVEILYAVSWQAADYMEEKGDPDGLSLATALRGSAAIVRKTMPKEV
ncbi:MAG TPA: hypothetical protein VHI13_00425 [Candidatus Kapabacteria bacterium]|nr:hypothetical protein [Candidatus Kapabacteria bacterium]